MPNLKNFNLTFASFLYNNLNGGMLLIVSALSAILLANTSLSNYYLYLFDLPITLQIGNFNFFSCNGHTLTLSAFINDALMAIFFLLVGLEVKREMLEGELSSARKAALPIIAALGGMLFPILVYLLIAQTPPESRGAPIPMATDIAFSLGMLSLLGKRVPPSLKIFLTAFAVVDDIGGILVIALGYTTHLQLIYLFIAMILLGLLLWGNYRGICTVWFYLIIGIVIWYMFLQSGIHSTISGFLVALTIPAGPQINIPNYINCIKECIDTFPPKFQDNTVLTNEEIIKLNKIRKTSQKLISPLHKVEGRLQGVVNYLIMPLFAFANAGIVFTGSVNNFFGKVTCAVALGLIIGKFTGIFSFIWLGVKIKFVALPKGSDWKSIAGVAMLGGVGFTVSLFIAGLAFGNTHNELLNQAKSGIILGTVCSAVLGYVILNRVLPKLNPKSK